MKIIWLLLIVIAFTFGLISGISWYLSPDDLKKCPQIPDASIAGCAKADAVVAISGGDTRARTAEAIRLYQLGWADTLIFSGAAYDKNSPSNARAMQAQAVAAGVSLDDTEVEEYARDTSENARKTRTLAAKHGAQRIVLVTSAYHQRRAGIEFRQSFEGVTIIDKPVATDKDWSSTWWLSARGWWLAGSELVKILAVQIKAAGVIS